jgi:hypothetical protein
MLIKNHITEEALTSCCELKEYNLCGSIVQTMLDQYLNANKLEIAT